MELKRIHAQDPVAFQCYGPVTKKWGTVSHHPARDMQTIERRRSNYPPTSIQTRWVALRSRGGETVEVKIDSTIELVGAR